MSARDDFDALMGAAQKVPGLMGQIRETVESFGRASRGGQRAYEKTHWGRKSPPGLEAATWIVDAPDPRSGVTELGRLVAVEYATQKGREREVAIYRHEFDTEPGSSRAPRDERLPVLGFTWKERPSGLVILRADSRYTVTPHGIEH